MAALAASPHANDQRYLRPVRSELDVIRASGMAPYTLLVDLVC